MAADFDPYHRWLGIPPEKQPANHYRMLGLTQFESDVEAIRDAAERQMAHVRLRALKHPELSQRILNELAAAKVCLLDPEKKAAYDAFLRKIRASRSKPEPRRWVGGHAVKWIAIGGAAGAGLSVAVLLAVFFAARRTEGPNEKMPATAVVASSTYESAPAVKGGQEAELPRRPPRLAKMADQTIDAGKELAVAAAVADRGSVSRPLYYRLGQGGPPGAGIDRNTGLVRWTPPQHLAPGKYTITAWHERFGTQSKEVTVAEALQSLGQLESVGGLAYIVAGLVWDHMRGRVDVADGCSVFTPGILESEDRFLKVRTQVRELKQLSEENARLKKLVADFKKKNQLDETPIKLGDKALLIPSHCDPTVNLHDWVVAIRKGKVEAVWPIEARGAVF